MENNVLNASRSFIRQVDMDATARQQWRQQQQAAAAQSRPVERTISNDRRQPKRTAAMAAEVEFDREEEPDEMPSDQRGGMLSLGKFRRRCSAVGADFQADDVPFERPSIRPPPAAPPLCRCNKPAVWVHNRWWCASGAVGANAQNGTVALGTYAGCSYEATPPPLPTTPECYCGRLAVWHRSRWWCDGGMMGCGFREHEEEERDGQVDEKRTHKDVAIEHAKDTAATLTAVAMGPLGEFAFVAGSSDACGRGLYARADLPQDLAIAEYGGPILPNSYLEHGDYALGIPSAQYFIDGNCENSFYTDLPRYLGIFCNHSSNPNARFEKRPIPNAGPHELKHRMIVVASERIPRGCEIRLDYDRRSASYNYWGGEPPLETSWREKRVAAPPPSGADAVAHENQPLPCMDIKSETKVLPWEGPNGGDARLLKLEPILTPHKSPLRWAYVATHIPGRTGEECRNRWLTLESVSPTVYKRTSTAVEPPPKPTPKPTPPPQASASAKKPVGHEADVKAFMQAPLPPPRPQPPPQPSRPPTTSAVKPQPPVKAPPPPVPVKAATTSSVKPVAPAKPATSTAPVKKPPPAAKAPPPPPARLPTAQAPPPPPQPVRSITGLPPLYAPAPPAAAAELPTQFLIEDLD